MTDDNQFTALVLQDAGDHKVTASIETLADDRLPDGDVTVGVEYSTLNYKDGMIVQGVGRLVRDYPHVPGIDFAGTVESSESPDYKPGDRVLLNGWRAGEVRWGGYATRARVPSGWVLPWPVRLSPAPCTANGPPPCPSRRRSHVCDSHLQSPLPYNFPALLLLPSSQVRAVPRRRPAHLRALPSTRLS